MDNNHNTGSADPVFTVIDEDGNEYKASDLIVLGTSAFKYNSDGAEGNRVWIETFAKVVLKDVKVILKDGSETTHAVMVTI